MSSDKLSKLSKKSLDEYFDYLSKQQLYYRDSLSLPKFVTFGVEIEYDKFKKAKVDKFTDKKLAIWLSKDELTLTKGGEISSPVLTDSLSSWKELREICNYLRKHRAVIDEKTGGHIHIGTQILGSGIESWRIFFKIYIIYENELIYFLNGNSKYSRRLANEFARPASVFYFNSLDTINEAKGLLEFSNKVFSVSKDKAISFCYTSPGNIACEKYNTIEFRSPNGTINELIWQNNINAITKFLLAARNKNIDEEFIDYKLEKGLDYFYSLPKALELADIIFDNDLDKMYFLKQYKKDFSFIEEKKKKTKVMSFK